MAITRERKKQTLEKLESIFKNSSGVVFVNFKGLNVSESQELRRDLKKSEVDYLVAKKSLVEMAIEKVFGKKPDNFSGELSLAFGTDSLEPARSIFRNQKKLAEKISIIGGLFEGEFLGKEKMMEIAQIPSRETLYAQFVNLINSPVQRFAVVIDQISKSKS